MARLIDADRLLRDPYFQKDRWPESHLIRMAVREQRTVDAAPLVHGRWLDEKHGFMYYDAACSVCGARNDRASNYCPHCGAKMDGDSDG